MSANQTLTRRLAHCIDVAIDVREAKALDEPQIDSLIIAAALLDQKDNQPLPVPQYAMDLLEAAKREFFEGSKESSAMLERAIELFEESMPIDSTGAVLTYGKSMFDERGD
jgi:hypothetical protein